MPCHYYNKEKDNQWDGIYCNKIGGRPGNSYWRCYCDSTCSECPHLGGRDPHELHSDTKERNRVIRQISDLPSRITIYDQEKIRDARRAYERLRYDQQRFVDNLSRLEAAERGYRAAVEAQQEQERAMYQKEQDDRRAREAQERRNREEERRSREAQVARTEHSKTTVRTWEEDSDYRNTDNSVQRSLFNRFLCWLENKTDPRMSSVPWKIRIYRIVMPVLGWLLVLGYRPEWPPLPTTLFIAYATLQLLSLGIGYIMPECMKFRLALWVIEFGLLAVVAGLLYQNPQPEILLEVGVVALIYPAAFLVCCIVKFICNIAIG